MLGLDVEGSLQHRYQSAGSSVAGRHRGWDRGENFLYTESRERLEDAR